MLQVDGTALQKAIAKNDVIAEIRLGGPNNMVES